MDIAVSANALDQDDETPLMIISAPRMEDAAGTSSEAITLKLQEKENSYEITLTADRDWISDETRTYPIKIDPSAIVLQSQIRNYTISSLAGAMPNQQTSHTGYFEDLGKTRSYVITDYLYQSILFGQKDVEILSASLNIYQLNDNTGFYIGCYRLKENLPRFGQDWNNTINIDRYMTGENSISAAGTGWHSFDIRDSVNGWMRASYESHGMVLIADNETAPGAMFATQNYPDTSLTPTVEIIWQPAGDIPFDYPLDDTTINLRPMTLTTTDGKMQCYGVFADGISTPGAYVAYTLSDTSKNYSGAMYTGNEKLYPDSSSFQAAFPAGTLPYKDRLSNWQTPYPFTAYDQNTIYTISAQAATAEKLGKKVTSDEFLIYQVTRYDTMQKIADYYGVPLATLLFDNKAADTLLVENNTLFIRNPQRNKNTPYQPSELTDEEKAAIDSALLGRALHCEYGFEPINLNTGNFYLAQEDFSYTDSLGTFALQRSYNGLGAGRMGSFGRGFTSLFDESISALSDGTIIYNRQDGSSLSFRPDGKGNYESPEGCQVSLKRIKTGERIGTFSTGDCAYDICRYDVTREDNSICSFDECGNLIQIRGEKGDILTFDRNSKGSLISITREGTTMPVTTTPEGCILSITMPNGGTYRYTYDAAQNLTGVTDPLGAAKHFTYDSRHRMTAWYDENGTRVVQNTYDANDRVIKQTNELGGNITLSYENGKTTATDPKGNTTVYEYDSLYRTTAIHYPDGTTETREYQNNQLVRQTDRLGTVTTFQYDTKGNITEKNLGELHNEYTYDEAGRLTGCMDALGNTTTAEYDTNGNLIKTTEADGCEKTYCYDNRNRLTEETDGNGNKTRYTYNGNFLSGISVDGTAAGTYTYSPMGQLLSHTDPEGSTTTYTYDLKGRMTAVKYPTGAGETITYDKKGLVLSTADAYGEGTSYTYDGCANILTITDAAGNRYEYTYDAVGNRTSETDPKGNITTNEYDEMNRVIKVTDKLGGICTYTYDAGGRMTCATDPEGGKMTITYDPYYDLPLTVTDPEGTITEYTYDLTGNVLSMTQAGEVVASYEYDTKGQLTKTTYASRLEESRHYDGNGNCTLITDQNGRNLSMEYDAMNRLTRQTTPSGRTYTYIYDGAGNLTGQTDPLGNRISYTYDGNGNILARTDGEGNTTTYAYDLNDRLILEKTPEAGEYRYAYDVLGRIITSADTLGYASTYEYDPLGNLTGFTDALGNKTAYEYDPLDRMTSETDPLGRKTTYAYDKNDNLISVTDALGSVTTYNYDKNNRLTAATDPMGRTAAYEYDPFSRLTKETDALGGVRLYEYDAAGSLTAYTGENGAKTQYTHDIYGNITSRIDANENKTEYTYNDENELILIKDAAGGTWENAYDGAGNITAATDPLGNRTIYAYDKENRLKTETAADGGKTAYTYDGSGNLLTVTDSLSRTTAYAYDKNGSLTEITDPAGGKTTYEYDPLGRMTAVTHADGTRTLAAYDVAGNMTFTREGEEKLTEYIYDALNRCTMKKDALGSETKYTYDAMGNLTSETAPDNTVTEYTYDALNRLISMTLPNDGTYAYAYDKTGNVEKVTGPTGTAIAYTYDPAGNLLTLYTAGSTTTYTYDALNRVTQTTDALGGRTTYTYDKAGNMTAATYADGASYTYEYDAMGRNTGIQTPEGLKINNTYDTEGQLLKQTLSAMTAAKTPSAAMGNNTTGNALHVPAATATEPSALNADEIHATAYEYDPLGNVKTITDALGGKTAYEYDALSRVTNTVSPGGTATAYAYDSLGNLTSLTDGEGNTTTYTYDAKGRLTEKTTAESTGDLTPREQTTTYTYDSRDRLTGVAEENSLVTYTYNTVGNLTSVTDANGNTTQYDYDRAGNLTQTLDPLGNRKQYGYDEAGRLTESTDENGNTTRYDYDALNRLVKKDTGETLSTASYEYDAMGRLTLMDDVTGESLYTYDHAGRLLTATDGNGKQITYAYDIYGNITEATYPDGRKAAYTYDALDRMTGVTTPEGKTTRYEYDADGNMTKAVREDGETSIIYDRLGRVKALANTKDGQIISVYAYAYDGRGNITREETRILKEGKLTETSALYTYDGKSQLIKAETREEGQSPATTTYTYDPAGNRLKMETEKGGKTLTVTYTYDEGGRLTRAEDSEGGVTAYEYDRAGNLITEKGDAVTDTDTGINTAMEEPQGSAGNGTDGTRTDDAAESSGTRRTMTERHYLYDASGRLTAVTDKDTLLLAALYDGSDNRTFTMEYAPELKAGTDAGTNGKTPGTEKVDAPETGNRDKNPGNDSGISQNGTGGETGDINEPGRQEETGGGNTGGTSTEKTTGAKAFWYGILCQTADILLPAPTPFKAWLHEKMGLTDDVSVLWTKEAYEAETGGSTLTVREAGSPFALMEDIFADTTGTELSAETYRQVNYVNDINCANTRVLMEYATNGNMGTNTTAYSYGIRRESYSTTETTGTVGSVMESVTTGTSGTYCYTGTGSVANLISSTGNRSCTYTPNGQMSTYAMDSPDGGSMAGNGNMADIGNNSSHGTYGAYGYNGEYTHTDLGLQYLRARYYNMTTGTFTSRDTYGGTLTDILSQNRYTYAENNPVTYADPSGHFSIKNAWNKVKAGASAVRTVAKAAVSPVASVVKKTYNAGGSVAKQAISTISRKMTHGSMSTITAPAGRMILEMKPAFNDFLTSSSLNDYVREQKNATWMEGFSKYLSAGSGIDLGQAVSAIPGTTPWVVSIASEVERKKCEVYEYCRNEVQELIKGKDITRIMNGIGLIASGLDKAAGGAALTLLSFKTAEFGIGIAGIVPSAFLMTSSYSDFEQGANEIRLGWQGNSLTPTANGVRDMFYDGNDMAYQLSTNIASMVATMGLAFVQSKPNPTIAGETDNIAEKAAMQADDVVEGGTGAQGVGNPVAVEGRGNTGRTVPNTLNEQIAMNQVQSNPLEGATKVPLEMTDPRWPASEGWVKMQSVVQNADGTKTTIHYVYNEITGAFDDFKFK